VSGFGMTETWIGVAFTGLHATPEERYEASGYPGLGYDVRIAEPETGRPLAPGEEGEIQVRGRYLMLGYYKKPEETVAAYTDDGWFRTGDAGCWTDRGYLRFLGRYKDMLKVGGENVDAAEVEQFLAGHEDIEQAQVVGVPDPRLSEVGCAFIVPKPGAVLDQAVTLGVNQGGGILFGNEDPASALTQARTAAVKDAIAKAGTLAAAAGVELGQIIEISEQAYNPRPMPYMARAEMASGAAPVEAGENSYRVQVNVTFGIGPQD
jgi:acyl-CoA synthetase (AMP-forming)/AMP-acid ligase II